MHSTSESAPIIRTDKLTKLFGNVAGIQNVSITVPRGQIYGLLGPNGAGKSSTVMLLLGLTRPTSGKIELFGHPVDRHRRNLHLRIGSLLESPSFYPSLSARTNLRVLARTAANEVGLERVDDVLNMVGLSERADAQLKTFSLGMRQRVGLAAAMLNDPELLILDDPFNGLDPLGIREFSDLMSSFRKAGKTIFLSTHLLNEVERLCDFVAFLNRGTLLLESSVEALRAKSEVVRVLVDDTEKAANLLTARGWKCRVQDSSIVVQSTDSKGINSTLFEEGIVASELRSEVVSIEALFHSTSFDDLSSRDI